MKKNIVIVSLALFFCFVFIVMVEIFKFHRPLYCELQILGVEIIEINKKKYVFINTDVSTIEKTFPNSYLLTTERSISPDINEINFSIVASHACLSSEIKAIPSSIIVLSDDFFTTGKSLMTTGKSKRYLFTINKITDKDTTRLEVEKVNAPCTSLTRPSW